MTVMLQLIRSSSFLIINLLLVKGVLIRSMGERLWQASSHSFTKFHGPNVMLTHAFLDRQIRDTPSETFLKGLNKNSFFILFAYEMTDPMPNFPKPRTESDCGRHQRMEAGEDMPIASTVRTCVSSASPLLTLTSRFRVVEAARAARPMLTTRNHVSSQSSWMPPTFGHKRFLRCVLLFLYRSVDRGLKLSVAEIAPYSATF